MSEPSVNPYHPVKADPMPSGGTAATSRPATGRWMAPVALLLSVLAAATAGWSLLKPAPTPQPPGIFAGNPSATDPKAEACRVAELVAEGVARQSRADLGPEPVALETVAANTRLAMAGGAAYLREATPSNTPAELAAPMETLARQLQDIAQHFFIGQSSAVPEQAERLKAATETTTTIAESCR
jgi:hypothetical protein